MRRTRKASLKESAALARFFAAAALLFCVLPAAMTARARQAATSATLVGRVEDASGATIPGAEVTATNVETNQSRTSTADGEGRYRFSYMPVGTYRLRAEKPGFAALTKQLTLTLGQALDVPLVLPVAGVAESVEVSGADVPVVETARTQVAETVAPEEIDSLPSNGRNYLDLAALTPGVTRANPVANQRFPETSSVPGTGLSVTGQRFINNGFVVDGLSSNDDAADLAGTFYSQEVIREFEVITSGGIAEFGRASGGVVNVVTRSGTNDYRGRVYGFLRNQRLDARNPLAPARDPFTQAQYGASFGGPLKRDRTFFFSNFEQTRLNNATVITITPTNVAAVNARLEQTGYAGPRVSTGVVPTGFDTTNFLFRLDHRADQSNQLMARYNLYRISSVNARNVGGLNATSRGTALSDLDQTAAASLVTTLSPRTINEARVQFTRSRLDAPVNDESGPAVNISGVANFGTATFSPTARGLDTFELVDNVSTERGAHSLKVGADFLLDRADITFPGALQGVYTFSSLANFQAGRYATYQQAFGEASQFQSNPNVGVFAQDEWKPRRDLTLNVGLRYDVQFLPSPVETDANNFAPRFGVAYSPDFLGHDHKTVIRAGYGIFFDRIPLRATSNALQRDGSKYRVAVLSFGQPGAPAFPNVLPSFPSNLLVSVTTIDPEIRSAYSQQSSLQVERELSNSTTLSVGYLHVRGEHIIVSRNVNAPRVPASAGVFNLGRPDPRFANVSRFESSADSYYDGLLVSFKRRLSRWAQTRVSYTFSKAIDDAGNAFFFSPQDNFNLRDERGLADNDQRHRLAVSGSFEAPPAGRDVRAMRRALSGFQLSYIFQYGSRLPFNVVTGTDRNNDTNVNDRPAGVGRNTGRGFDFASLDLRLSRRFVLGERVNVETIVEGFNVLNRANLQLPNNTLNPANPSTLLSFGRPTAADNPRQIQFGLRLNF
ncbi:MAG TPA: carboxypeptidase regulatory-like domain-containing protein [Pyrinomonadaceae bacterium]|nr:carboxypeptidase regulatory-like domain-containing protein [Pyrinomonadaceae bacterium]